MRKNFFILTNVWSRFCVATTCLFGFKIAVILGLFMTSVVHAESNGAGESSYERSNCRLQSLVDRDRITYSTEPMGRSQCLILQGLSILGLNSFVPGQYVRHEDHVNSDDHGFVEFLNPVSQKYEKCEYSVSRGQKLSRFVQAWLNNELEPEKEGVHSLEEAFEKARDEVLSSVFINCGVS